MADAARAGAKSSHKLRVLELYSGIGGMHYALKESGLDFEVVGAVDINNVANDIYRHNFPDVRMMQRAIESLSLRELEKLEVTMVTMSPPCQPFTRVGKQKDDQDQRTKSFFHFLSLLEQIEKKPDYVLVENVKGFDTSLTRHALLETLQKCHYRIQEFLLTPLQFGIPNSRLRFFLLAKREPLSFCFPLSPEIHTELPNCAEELLIHKVRNSTEGSSTQAEEPCFASPSSQSTHPVGSDVGSSHQNNCGDAANHQRNCSGSDVQQSNSDQTCLCGSAIGGSANQNGLCYSCDKNNAGASSDSDSGSIAAYVKYHSICQSLERYLENQLEDYFRPFLIPEKFLPRFWVMDIVKPSSRNTCCFTKRYGHHIEGAGSVLQMDVESKVDLSAYKKDRVYNEDVENGVRSMKLRFFTPQEIANVMCFPDDFSFPPGLSTIQCYRVLGNSLSVHCVSVLMKLLCKEA